jgi:hypothetical protein
VKKERKTYSMIVPDPPCYCVSMVFSTYNVCFFNEVSSSPPPPHTTTTTRYLFDQLFAVGMVNALHLLRHADTRATELPVVEKAMARLDRDVADAAKVNVTC